MIRGRNATIALKDGRIAKVGKGGGRRYVGPGLVDLQINGFRGLDFNTLPLAAELPGKATRELWSEGVTSYLATLITNSPEAIEEACRGIARGREEDEAAREGIVGLHLEGPFISPDDGPRGAHAKSFVRAPDWDLFRRWQDASGGIVRMITLSPEWPGSTAFIEKAAASDVLVSIGHTGATPEQVRDAVAAGARVSTHLGNGAHLVLPRHPNYLWEQLADDRLSACFIADGFHLPDAVMKVITRVKGRKALLVSDAVYLAGLPPGTYDTHIGGKVVLTDEGKLHLASNRDLLAGSASMLLRGVERLVASGIADLEEAWSMASARPAALLGLSAAKGLKSGAPGDLALVEERDGRLELVETYKNGVRVYRRS